VIGENGVKLSGGQRQRLGIARALYTRPKPLVLDEATSDLDAETEQAIAQTLQELEDTVTAITIAHRLATIRHCDLMVYLEGGRLRARAPQFDKQAATAGSVRQTTPRLDEANEWAEGAKAKRGRDFSDCLSPLTNRLSIGPAHRKQRCQGHDLFLLGFQRLSPNLWQVNPVNQTRGRLNRPRSGRTRIQHTTTKNTRMEAPDRSIQRIVIITQLSQCLLTAT
jgi:ABC-type multidrug transport system ATPase subunit